MHIANAWVGGPLLGVIVAACGSALGTAQKATEIAFTAAEAACLGAHANEGPAAAGAACSIEQQRLPGVEVIVVPELCANAVAAASVPSVLTYGGASPHDAGRD